MVVSAARAAALCMAAALGAALPVLPAHAAHEARHVEDFDRIELRTGARVVIRQGDRDGVDVEAGAAVLPLIATRVDNATLRIEDGQGYGAQPAQVTVTMRQVRGISTTGATQVSAEGLSGRELSITSGGQSAVSLRRIDVGRLRVALGGNSQLAVSGSTRELTAQLGGGAGLDAAQLDADSAMVQGGGTARATVCVRSALSVAIGGAADVSYYGTVKPTVAIAGMATLKALGPMPATLR